MTKPQFKTKVVDLFEATFEEWLDDLSLINHDESPGFNDTPYEDLMKSEVDKALQYLLDHDMLSMEWDPVGEEMVYYMTEKQRAMPKPEDWDTAM